jgi:hypothetical protein
MRRILPRGMPSAIKHGAYSGKLLPGEDRTSFEKLHRDVVAEFSPNGPVEEDIILKVASLLWRKKNVQPVRAAGRAWNRYNRIESRLRNEMCKKFGYAYTVSMTEFAPEVERELRRVVDEEARDELGDDYKFIEAGTDQTLGEIMKNFEFEARLDAMIDVCIKRLLHVRGLKSLSVSSSTSSAALIPPPASKKAV